VESAAFVAFVPENAGSHVAIVTLLHAAQPPEVTFSIAGTATLARPPPRKAAKFDELGLLRLSFKPNFSSLLRNAFLSKMISPDNYHRGFNL